MIDASYHTNPSLQSTALIITCAVVLLLMAAIVSVVFWKHKRKVQNLLPCKSAAGAAAAAAAVAASGRNRVLADGQSHGGTGSAGGAVLYEDLPEAVTHSQLHNHLPSHHPGGQAPTIEVRNPDQRQSLRERQPQQLQRARAPAPHHLDYLDYRDPRAILRVQDKPSRAVLGGYRTPRALLAKSQGVPLSIATHAPPRGNAVTSPLLQNGNNLLRSSHLLLASQNALITSQQPLPPTPPPRVPCVPTSPDAEVTLTSDKYLGDGCVSARPVDSRLPITPTHRPRVQPPFDKSQSHVNSSTQPQQRVLSRDEVSNSRRPSVDSEGYSYIDFKDTDLESTRYDSSSYRSQVETGTRVSSMRLFLSSTRSNSVDSDGYSYIVDSGSRKAPGTARRIVAEGTEEEVCPLCTMQQIHSLLSKPEDIYLNVQST
ncbi:putative Hedgehog signaling attenuator pxb isoform X2 [Calliopsis andreniformis]|uniref:putative Hedgehog signaling attenuator pxb isoform X2 n=1 Tax=Calliopsis andreniformis TaxID=337506 RepID=UPI003FCD4115